MSSAEIPPATLETGAILLPAPEQASPLRVARAIPFRLAISIPLSGLKLRDLRSLRVGQLFTTDVSAAEDVPVRAGGAVLGWAELDNLDGQMAVRLTHLA